MTRVNVGILPRELPDRLLLAEVHEILRIPRRVRQIAKAHKRIMLPPRFKLGAGHVSFFYGRLGYLRRRYNTLVVECHARGFKVRDSSEEFEGLPTAYMRDYHETPRDRKIIKERIQSKGFKLR